MFGIRRTRTVAQGRRKLTREREEHFRLVQQGVSYTEAARLVGASRSAVPRPVDALHVSEADRAGIHVGHGSGVRVPSSLVVVMTPSWLVRWGVTEALRK